MSFYYHYTSSSRYGSPDGGQVVFNLDTGEMDYPQSLSTQEPWPMAAASGPFEKVIGLGWHIDHNETYYPPEKISAQIEALALTGEEIELVTRIYEKLSGNKLEVNNSVLLDAWKKAAAEGDAPALTALMRKGIKVNTLIDGEETALGVVLTAKWDIGPLSTKFDAARDVLKDAGGMTAERLHNRNGLLSAPACSVN